MHLNFSDTSPLKVFASSLRSKLPASWANYCECKGSVFAASGAGDVLAPADTALARLIQIAPKRETKRMAKREVNYPHTIGFRVTDQTWFRILQEVAGTDLTPHDWCRMVVLDRLDREYGFSKKERLLFEQIVRTQFFVAFGFQMLADDTLTGDAWKKLRAYAKEKADYLAKETLAHFRSRMERNEQQLQS